MYKSPIRNTKLFEQGTYMSNNRLNNNEYKSLNESVQRINEQNEGPGRFPELTRNKPAPITTNRAGGLAADICHEFRFSRDFFCQGNKHGDNMNYPPYNCSGDGCTTKHADGTRCAKWRKALSDMGCPALGPGFDDWRPVIAKDPINDLPGDVGGG